MVMGVESKIAVSNYEVEFVFKKGRSGELGASILHTKVADHN